MSFTQFFVPEFDREMATTRRLLERVPFANPEWTPHTKSMTIKKLASHIATIPLLGIAAATTTDYDYVLDRQPTPDVTSTAELVAQFDELTKTLREAIVDKTDAELLAIWNFKMAGKLLLSMPKGTALRSMFMNHLIHHRGQLSVYLRLNEVPLPPIYGPSADES